MLLIYNNKILINQYYIYIFVFIIARFVFKLKKVKFFKKLLIKWS